MAGERDVTTLLGHNLVEVLPDKKEAVLQVVATGEHVRLGYDLLHVTPPMGPIPAIQESDVSNSEVSSRRGLARKKMDRCWSYKKMDGRGLRCVRGNPSLRQMALILSAILATERRFWLP